MIKKLQSKRTGELADIVKVKKDSYVIRKADGSEKTLSASTIKRWWKEIEVEGEPAPKPEKTITEKKSRKGKIVKKSEDDSTDSVHHMVAKKMKNNEHRQPLLDVILHYGFKEDLTAEKKKIYIGLYYGDRRVAEMRPTQKGIRVAVHPKVVESLTEEDLQKVTVQPKSYRVYFNVIYLVETTDDLEFVKKLIQLSKAKVLKTYKG